MFKNTFEIFWRFLLLGCVSFGGPAAHIGYFQKAFVQQYKWLPQEKFGQLLSLSQFLPGPGSSQLGFAIGMHRGGIFGGIAAFIGFTLPSFFLLYLLAINLTNDQPTWIESTIHALKLLAVVVVADACLSMFSSFCKSKITQAIAVFTAVFMLVSPNLTTQLLLLVVAAIMGMVLLSANSTSKAPTHADANPDTQANKHLPLLAVLVFISPFLVMFLAPAFKLQLSPTIELFNQFYQAGSLVFGGGHVVLPLLQQSIGEALTHNQFLTGYASAQAVPGPMFTLATFLGAILTSDSAFTGALIATLAIFLPGFLLLIALSNVWKIIAEKPKVFGAISAVNAAVVGLLISALYKPVFSSGVHSGLDMALVFVGFYLLRSLKVSILLLVAFFITAGVLLF